MYWWCRIKIIIVHINFTRYSRWRGCDNFSDIRQQYRMSAEKRFIRANNLIRDIDGIRGRIILNDPSRLSYLCDYWTTIYDNVTVISHLATLRAHYDTPTIFSFSLNFTIARRPSDTVAADLTALIR